MSDPVCRGWRVRGRDIDLSRTLVMGILNVTPDSFSDGGMYEKADIAAAHAKALVSLGADIIDIGGQSTRPGCTPITPDEEWSRLEPVLTRLCGRLDALISIDTFYPEVARRALALGADIINDVTGFSDSQMRSIAAESGCGCIIMHSDDIEALFPDDGADAPPDCRCAAADNTVTAVTRFFEERTRLCIADGIDERCIMLDCGIGFGKSRAQDHLLLARMGDCRYHARPMLAAASRKRVVRRYWPELSPDEGTSAAHALAIAAGADAVRVHMLPLP